MVPNRGLSLRRAELRPLRVFQAVQFGYSAKVNTTQFQPFCSKPLQPVGRLNRPSVKPLSREYLREVVSARVAQSLISLGLMGNVLPFASIIRKAESGPRDSEPDAPDYPLDEPRPPRIEDPPPQPAPEAPYVVGARRRAKQEERP